MIRAAAGSVANISIYPLQDILEIGTEGRMNRPAAVSGNWSWRFGLDALKPEFAARLAALAEMTDRDGYEKPVEGDTAGGPTDFASLRLEEGATR
jgi:4-alpha-glucanotransferase